MRTECSSEIAWSYLIRSEIHYTVWNYGGISSSRNIIHNKHSLSIQNITKNYAVKIRLIFGRKPEKSESRNIVTELDLTVVREGNSSVGEERGHPLGRQRGARGLVSLADADVFD